MAEAANGQKKHKIIADADGGDREMVRLMVINPNSSEAISRSMELMIESFGWSEVCSVQSIFYIYFKKPYRFV